METNTVTDVKAYLDANFKDVMTTDEMREKFEVVSFLAPFVMVVRKADGVKGTLEFVHMPRYYYNFIEA